MSATAMPWFDLNMWSAWASLAGLIVSVWVWVRTGAIAKTIRSTEDAIYQRLCLADRVREVDDIRKDLHILAMESDTVDAVEAPELFRRIDAMVSQLRDVPASNIKACLCKLDSVRYRSQWPRKIKHTVTKQRLKDIREQVAELLAHLHDYEKQVKFLGSRS